MERFDIAVIGGGASGITAAISAGRKSASVAICERMGALGKKILASGGGRCNLLNERLDESCYNSGSMALVRAVLARFGKGAIEDFFGGLGLELSSDGGRIFPATNQASSVLRALELELKRLSVHVKLGFDVAAVSSAGDGFLLASKDGRRVSCRKLIIAAGGKSYPALGSDGSSYRLAGAYIGHRIIAPVPSAVPLVVKDGLLHPLQGQRITASARAIIDGRIASEAAGELLFAKYGLSGTAILDISEEVSIAINRLHKRNVYVSVDMVPFVKEDTLKAELAKRKGRGVAAEDLLVGILPNKFGAALKEVFRGKDPGEIAKSLKERRFVVSGTRGWNEAEFTAGGVDTKEVDGRTLESRLKKGIYFAGEVLDVQGRRGGYNLAWAWASGYVAGLGDGSSL